MKPAFALPLATAVLAGLLAGCGQTGPLYLPHPPKEPAALPTPPGQPNPSAPASDVPTSGVSTNIEAAAPTSGPAPAPAPVILPPSSTQQ